MSARKMFDALNRKAPVEGKEKHRGNSRAALPRLKKQARQDERHAVKHELEKQLKDEE